VKCEQCREELSARLDGEDDPARRPAVDAHVSECEECQQWSDDAAAVTRLIRMSVVTGDPSAIRETVLDAAPGPGRRRVAGGLRIALGVLGAAQFALGMAQVSAFSTAAHDHAGVGVSSAHLWHESAAWNVALGAGFGWIAVRRSRPSGLVPLLTAFVGLLTLLSANDFWMGQVDATRLFSHGLIVAGYLIVVALTRPGFDFGEPPQQRMRVPGRWSVRFDDDAQATPRHLRVLRSHLPPQSARHDRAA
jgi:predicted anti-sigma-YlaC factor YlaD